MKLRTNVEKVKTGANITLKNFVLSVNGNVDSANKRFIKFLSTFQIFICLMYSFHSNSILVKYFSTLSM